MRGRKPKPTRQKELAGNPGKRPINRAEPELPPPEEDFSLPPPELAGDERATQEWARLAPMLSKAKVITQGERASLVALCQQWSRYLEANEKARAIGMIVTTPTGYPLPNPLISIANKALQHCTRLWAELGLTPSARTRVVRAPGGDDGPSDPFAEFDTPVGAGTPKH